MKITGNSKFEEFVGKYVILEVDGRKKKYFVDTVDNCTGTIPNSSYIFGNSYKIIGLATLQNCETCQDVVNITGFTSSSAILQNSQIDLTVNTYGATALNYLWYQNNVLLYNSTSSLNIPNFSSSDVGTYYVTVSGACNLVDSESCVLTLLPPPSPSPSPSPSISIEPSPSPTSSLIFTTPTDIIPTPTPSITPPSTPTPTVDVTPTPTPSLPPPSPSPSMDIPPATPTPSPTPYPP